MAGVLNCSEESDGELPSRLPGTLALRYTLVLKTLLIKR
jgi:hypothetical protein